MRCTSLQRATVWVSCPLRDLSGFMPERLYVSSVWWSFATPLGHHSRTGLVYILLVAQKNKHNFPISPFFSREQFVLGGIMGRISAEHGKLLRLLADQEQPIQPHELDSYLLPGVVFFLFFVLQNNNNNNKNTPLPLGTFCFMAGCLSPT